MRVVVVVFFFFLFLGRWKRVFTGIHLCWIEHIAFSREFSGFLVRLLGGR